MNWELTPQQTDDYILYGMCPNRHPRAVRTTIKIMDSAVIHEEIYCPTCENDGTLGTLILGTH